MNWFQSILPFIGIEPQEAIPVESNRGSFLQELDRERPELHGRQNPEEIQRFDQKKAAAGALAGALQKGSAAAPTASPPGLRQSAGQKEAKMKLLAQLPELAQFLAGTPSVNSRLFGGF